MNNSKKILIADSDEKFCDELYISLKKYGYRPLIATSREQTMVKFCSLSPSLVLIDMEFLVADGWEIFLRMKQKMNVPIIVIVEKGGLLNGDVAIHFDLLDGFVVKPVNFEELLLKIKVATRKNIDVKEMVDKKAVEKENLKIDIKNYELFVSGKRKKAAPKEIELLYKLASNENKLFTREQLLDEVWGYEYIGSSRTVDVHIRKLRSKLKNASSNWGIETVWGVGYIFKSLS